MNDRVNQNKAASPPAALRTEPFFISVVRTPPFWGQPLVDRAYTLRLKPLAFNFNAPALPCAGRGFLLPPIAFTKTVFYGNFGAGSAQSGASNATIKAPATPIYVATILAGSKPPPAPSPPATSKTVAPSPTPRVGVGHFNGVQPISTGTPRPAAIAFTKTVFCGRFGAGGSERSGVSPTIKAPALPTYIATIIAGSRTNETPLMQASPPPASTSSPLQAGACHRVHKQMIPSCHRWTQAPVVREIFVRQLAPQPGKQPSALFTASAPTLPHTNYKLAGGVVTLTLSNAARTDTVTQAMRHAPSATTGLALSSLKAQAETSQLLKPLPLGKHLSALPTAGVQASRSLAAPGSALPLAPDTVPPIDFQMQKEIAVLALAQTVLPHFPGAEELVLIQDPDSHERHSQIQEENKTALSFDMADEPVTVIVSQKGWCRVQQGHGHEAAQFQFKAGDALYATFECRSVDYLIALDSHGRVYSVAVNDLPRAGGDGLALNSWIELEAGSRLMHFYAGSAEDHLLLATTHGHGVSAKVGDLTSPQHAGKSFMTFDDGAEPLAPVKLPPKA